MVVGLLPASQIKNALLRKCGFAIAERCSFGISLLLGTREVRLDAGCRISNFNVFRGLEKISMKSNASIGSWNWFSAATEFTRQEPRACFVIGRESAVTSRHYIDCSGGVLIGDFSTVAGQRSTFLSHGIDFDRNIQTTAPINIGDACFVSTGCTVLKGATLASKSVLAAGAVLTSQDPLARPGLWAGVPAVWKKEVKGAHFERQRGRVGTDSDA